MEIVKKKLYEIKSGWLYLSNMFRTLIVFHSNKKIHVNKLYVKQTRKFFLQQSVYLKYIYMYVYIKINAISEIKY